MSHRSTQAQRFPRNTIRYARRIGSALLLAAIAIGCAGDRDGPGGGRGGRSSQVDEAERYAGPPLSVATTSERHQVVLQAPSSGWAFTFDRVEPQALSADVYVTITRPDPDRMYTQAVVEQRLDSTVQPRLPVRVFARLVDFGAKPERSPYRFAARSTNWE